MDIISHLVIRRKNGAFKVMAILLAMVCLVGSLSQTAQAENTFVITDGDAVVVHTTTADFLDSVLPAVEMYHLVNHGIKRVFDRVVQNLRRNV